MQRFLPLIMLAVLTVPANAWDTRGHQVVVAIAQDYLSPQAQIWVEHCLQQHTDARLHSLESAAIWPDAIRQERPESKPWHYINLPFGPASLTQNIGTNQTADNQSADNQIVWALEHFREQAQINTEPNQRAEALAFLIHLVGDIHQPLHCFSYYAPGLELGDKGGQNIPFATPWSSDLHQFWDSAGYDPHMTVTELKALSVRSGAGPDVQEINFKLWAEESQRFAALVAYPGGSPPASQVTPEYQEQTRQLCLHRLFIAGLRLSTILERLGPGADYH